MLMGSFCLGTLLLLMSLESSVRGLLLIAVCDVNAKKIGKFLLYEANFSYFCDVRSPSRV